MADENRRLHFMEAGLLVEPRLILLDVEQDGVE